MADKATAKRSDAAAKQAEPSRWERPAAAPRVIIVQVLGLADAPLTVRQIEAEVTRLIRVGDVATIEEQLQELLDVGHVKKAGTRKAYVLTDSGREMYETVRPFSKG